MPIDFSPTPRPIRPFTYYRHRRRRSVFEERRLEGARQLAIKSNLAGSREHRLRQWDHAMHLMCLWAVYLARRPGEIPTEHSGRAEPARGVYRTGIRDPDLATTSECN